MGSYSDYVSSGLTAFHRILVDTYCSIPWQTTKCGYGCSDHASWTKTGVAAVYTAESIMSKENPNIHSTGDSMATVDVAYGVEFVILALAHVVELGSASAVIAA